MWKMQGFVRIMKVTDDSNNDEDRDSINDHCP